MRRTPPLTIHFNTPPVHGGICVNRTNLAGLLVLAAALVAAPIGLHSGLSQAAESAGPPAKAAMTAPPAGAYKLDKSHASLVLRASHMGFSTYTTRFSRFDADLTLDPRDLSASKVVTTIEASSFEMDAAPQMCLDIMKGPQMLDTAKFPQIVFKSEKIRMTGAKSMEISGTLTLHGVTRPTVLVATYNGGYAGMPNMDPQARVGFSAHGSFKRSDFGIVYGVPAPGTTLGVGDLIDFSIEAEFTGPPLAAPAAQTH
jgi:polyisoprenoid-binding protein YceI